MVRVRYAPASELIFIDIIANSLAGEELRELSQEYPLRARLLGNFNADVNIRISGTRYSDDEGDSIDPRGQPLRQGFHIGNSDRSYVGMYLQRIRDLSSK